MKGILGILYCLLLLCCGTGKNASVHDAELSSQRPDGLRAQINDDRQGSNGIGTGTSSLANKNTFTDTVRIKEIINYLASDELEGRDSGSPGIEKAALYIESLFMNNGLEMYFNSYRDTLTNYNTASYNIVGMVPGKDKDLAGEYIILGAHYDHVGIISSATDDKIANGANDNASGTATVLELARYFGMNRTNKRSLLFVLFSAEEKGLLGSAHLAQKLNEQGFNLYAMLNFEMTGVPMQQKDYLLYLTGYERSNLAELCNQYAGESLVGFLQEAKNYQLFQRSDNYPFHKAFNVPSQTYCTFDFTNYDYYHKVGDESFRLDFSHMSNVVNKMIPVVEGLANGLENEIKYY